MSTAETTTASRPITTGKSVGRLVGVLLLFHLMAGLIVPFILLHPRVGAQGFLVIAAEVANQTRLAVFLLFVGSVLANRPVLNGKEFWKLG